MVDAAAKLQTSGSTRSDRPQGVAQLLVDHALQYAGRGWRVFPVHTATGGACSCSKPCGIQAGKHPRIKAWQNAATVEPAQIIKWWRRWPDANIGIATGGRLVVVDLDGAAEIEQLRSIAEPHGGLPETLVAATARGFHIYLAGDWNTTKKVDGLLVRGTGGYVIAPPSLHASGKQYQWVKDVPLAPMPDWFEEWLQSAENTTVTADGNALLLAAMPEYLQSAKAKQNQQPVSISAKAGLSTPQSQYEIKRLASALAAIPANCDRDTWLKIGMSLHSLDWTGGPDGVDQGFALWAAWSETGGDKFQGLFDLETRWKSFGRRGGVGLGTLYHIAEQNGWLGLVPTASEPAKLNGHHVPEVAPLVFTARDPEHPLIELNAKYATIGDVGGKCLVLGWVPSKVDPVNEVPSFQTFKSFSERYAHKYVDVPNLKKRDAEGAPEMESKQLGAHWLKWGQRRSFEGIDLVPGQGPTVGNNVMNLWRGFATPPIAPGQPSPSGYGSVNWDRMQAHIAEVLADGDAAALEYIMKWSAWAVQNPGERAEAALVFRGGKGSGKGTFAHALRRMFGAHGLHIANPKHLVGAFNAHLRNCLLLYADEAFWAGDKQGESTLKALITESTLTIEQKGVDAVQWHNRIHLIMTANAEWVVPASHDERRYVVLNVSEKYVDNERYFQALHDEIAAGGLSAMLHDLQQVDLKGWHPRKILKTEALLQQKMQSMNPLQEWWADMLEAGYIPAAPKDSPDSAMAVYLMNHAREFGGRKLHELTPTRLGRFLSDHGCIKLHKAAGNAWRFPSLGDARARWSAQYFGWKFGRDARQWEAKA